MCMSIYAQFPYMCISSVNAFFCICAYLLYMRLYRRYVHILIKNIYRGYAHIEKLHIYERYVHIHKLHIYRDCYVRILRKLRKTSIYPQLMYMRIYENCTHTHTHIKDINIYIRYAQLPYICNFIICAYIEVVHNFNLIIYSTSISI